MRPRECTAESTRVGFEVVVVVVELLDSAERPGSFVLHHSTIRRLPSLIGMPSGVSLLLLEVIRYRSQRPNPQLPRPLARSCLSVFATVFDRSLRRCKRWRCSASRTVSLSGALPPFFLGRYGPAHFVKWTSVVTISIKHNNSLIVAKRRRLTNALLVLSSIAVIRTRRSASRTSSTTFSNKMAPTTSSPATSWP